LKVLENQIKRQYKAEYLTALWRERTKIPLKGHSTSGKMNVYLKWVIYVEEMRNYF